MQRELADLTPSGAEDPDASDPGGMSRRGKTHNRKHGSAAIEPARYGLRVFPVVPRGKRPSDPGGMSRKGENA